MQNKFIETFLKQFFIENDCKITQEEPGIMEVALTINMDKALMNRPFYWQYVETTGQQGVPLSLKLITDKDKRNEKGEWITFGSPRLQQIGNYLERQARFTRLFQSLEVHTNTMLQPWLLTNYCIMYEGKQNKEEMFSIGLNLINGMMVFDMMELLANVKLEPIISDYCYTISPLIKLNSGFLRIEKYIEEYIKQQEHQWAISAYKLLQEELQMIQHFYHDDVNEEEMKKEKNAVSKRLAPTITHQVISGGILYLGENILKQANKSASARSASYELD